VAVIVVAVMDLAVIILPVVVMDLFWGRYRLWPSLLWPSLFVAVIVVPRETGAINWLHFSGAGFSFRVRLE